VTAPRNGTAAPAAETGLPAADAATITCTSGRFAMTSCAASLNSGHSRAVSWPRLPGKSPRTGRSGSRPRAAFRSPAVPGTGGRSRSGWPTKVAWIPRSRKNASSNGRITARRATSRAMRRTRDSCQAHSWGAT